MQRVYGSLKKARIPSIESQARYNSTSAHHDIGLQHRLLMRTAAQPVTVLTTCLNNEKHSLHGATLSSYASVALHPLPLVSFAIRKPSRLADALHANRLVTPGAVHGIVNILSEQQFEAARMFSRPDLYAEPFRSVPHRREDGMPVLEDSVGALACSILTTLPMTGSVLKKFGIASHELQVAPDTDDNSSELFLARVIRVIPSRNKSNNVKKPLVYHAGQFTTIL